MIDVIAGSDHAILPAYLFLAIGQPLQINLRLNNNPAALYRDGNGHPGAKAVLFQPVAFKVDGGGRVGFTIMRGVSHGIVTLCFQPLPF